MQRGVLQRPCGSGASILSPRRSAALPYWASPGLPPSLEPARPNPVGHAIVSPSIFLTAPTAAFRPGGGGGGGARDLGSGAIGSLGGATADAPATALEGRPGLPVGDALAACIVYRASLQGLAEIFAGDPNAYARACKELKRDCQTRAFLEHDNVRDWVETFFGTAGWTAFCKLLKRSEITGKRLR
jgi:hypothetical protein